MADPKMTLSDLQEHPVPPPDIDMAATVGGIKAQMAKQAAYIDQLQKQMQEKNAFIDDQTTKGNAFIAHLNGQLDAARQKPAWREGGDGHARMPCPTFGSTTKEIDEKLGAEEFRAWLYQVEMWYAASSASPMQKATMLVTALRGKAANMVSSAIPASTIATMGVQPVVDLLQSLYLGDACDGVLQTMRQLLRAKKGNKTWAEYAMMLHNINLRLASFGQQIPGQAMGALSIMLADLNREEEAMVLAASGRSLEFGTIQQSMRQILGGSHAGKQEGMALWAGDTQGGATRKETTTAHGGPKGGKGQPWTNRDCWNCGIPGHFSRECRKPWRTSPPSHPPPQKGGGKGHTGFPKGKGGRGASAWVSQPEDTNSGAIQPNEESKAKYESLFTDYNDGPMQDMGFGFGYVTCSEVCLGTSTIKKYKVRGANGNQEGNALKKLCIDTPNEAVLDSACTQSVCGTLWLEAWMNANPELRKEVVKLDGENIMAFGAGVQKTVGKVGLPIRVANTKGSIVVWVVDGGLPLLLSLPDMRMLGMNLMLSRNSVVIDKKEGGSIELICRMTDTGHQVLDITGRTFCFSKGE